MKLGRIQLYGLKLSFQWVVKILPSESHVWNEKDWIEENTEKIVEAGDEATHNTLGGRVGQLCCVLEEKDSSDADKTRTQNCRYVKFNFAEWNNLK